MKVEVAVLGSHPINYIFCAHKAILQQQQQHTHTNIYLFIYLYICVCVCIYIYTDHQVKAAMCDSLSDRVKGHFSVFSSHLRRLGTSLSVGWDNLLYINMEELEPGIHHTKKKNTKKTNN